MGGLGGLSSSDGHSVVKVLQAKSCAKGVLPLACRLGQVLQNALHFEVATGDPHPFGNLRETPINYAARPRPVR